MAGMILYRCTEASAMLLAFTVQRVAISVACSTRQQRGQDRTEQAREANIKTIPVRKRGRIVTRPLVNCTRTQAALFVFEPHRLTISVACSTRQQRGQDRTEHAREANIKTIPVRKRGRIVTRPLVNCTRTQAALFVFEPHRLTISVACSTRQQRGQDRTEQAREANIKTIPVRKRGRIVTRPLVNCTRTQAALFVFEPHRLTISVACSTRQQRGQDRTEQAREANIKTIPVRKRGRIVTRPLVNCTRTQAALFVFEPHRLTISVACSTRQQRGQDRTEQAREANIKTIPVRKRGRIVTRPLVNCTRTQAALFVFEPHRLTISVACSTRQQRGQDRTEQAREANIKTIPVRKRGRIVTRPLVNCTRTQAALFVFEPHRLTISVACSTRQQRGQDRTEQAREANIKTIPVRKRGRIVTRPLVNCTRTQAALFVFEPHRLTISVACSTRQQRGQDRTEQAREANIKTIPVRKRGRIVTRPLVNCTRTQAALFVFEPHRLTISVACSTRQQRGQDRTEQAREANIKTIPVRKRGRIVTRPLVNCTRTQAALFVFEPHRLTISVACSTRQQRGQDRTEQAREANIKTIPVRKRGRIVTRPLVNCTRTQAALFVFEPHRLTISVACSTRQQRGQDRTEQAREANIKTIPVRKRGRIVTRPLVNCTRTQAALFVFEPHRLTISVACSTRQQRGQDRTEQAREANIKTIPVRKRGRIVTRPLVNCTRTQAALFVFEPHRLTISVACSTRQQRGQDRTEHAREANIKTIPGAKGQ